MIDCSAAFALYTTSALIIAARPHTAHPVLNYIPAILDGVPLRRVSGEREKHDLRVEKKALQLLGEQFWQQQPMLLTERLNGDELAASTLLQRNSFRCHGAEAASPGKQPSPSPPSLLETPLFLVFTFMDGSLATWWRAMLHAPRSATR